MLLENQADGSNHRQRGEREKHKERLAHFAPHCIFTRITKLEIATFAIDIGNNSFHPNAINWSYRKRGSVPRIHT